MDRVGNYEKAMKLERELTRVKGAADVCLHERMDGPHFHWTVDRAKAIEAGLTQNDISNSFLTSLSSSFQTKPNFYLNSKTGIVYNLAAQTPQYSLSNINQLSVIPSTPNSSNEANYPPALMMTMAKQPRTTTPAVINHFTVMRLYDIYATTQNRD